MMSRIVKEVSRLAFPLFAVFSFYIIIHGHLTPGGGFQGGVVMASAAAMLMVAYGVRDLESHLPSIRTLFGVFSFLMLAYFGSHFLHHPISEWLHSTPLVGPNIGNLVSAGAIPLMSLMVGLEVMVGITILAILMRRWA